MDRPKRNRGRAAYRGSALALVAGLSCGCNVVFGVDDLCYDCRGGGGQGATTTSSSSSGAGQGGGVGGSGGDAPCSEGEVRACYDGPPATEGVGLCLAGQQACAGDSGWAACEGQVLPATEICGDGDDRDCNGYDCGETVWVKTFGGSQDDEARRVQVLAEGGLALAGTFSGSIDFGGGELAAGWGQTGFSARLDAAGAHLASWALGAVGTIQTEGLALFPAGDVLVGADLAGTIDLGGQSITSAGGLDGLVVRSDAQGQPLWAASFGGGQNDNVQQVAVLPSGDVLVAGYLGAANGDFMGTPLQNYGGNDVVVARLAGQSGAVVWAQSYGSPGAQYSMDVEATADSGGLVVGLFENQIDFGGGAHTSAGAQDAFALRLGGSGQEIWSVVWGAAGNQQGLAVAVGEGGESVVVGATQAAFSVGQELLPFAGTEDAFAIKLDAAGQPLWARSFGGPGTDSATGVAIDPTGAVWLVGRFQESIDLGGGPLTGPAGQTHMFVAKLAADGSHLHSRAFLTTNLGSQPFGSWPDWRQIDVDAQGFATFAGYFRNSVDFGLGPVASAGGADVFVVKLAP